MSTSLGKHVTLTKPDDFGKLLEEDRKSTRLNSSHDQTSYAVFCLKKKNSYAMAATFAPHPSRSASISAHTLHSCTPILSDLRSCAAHPNRRRSRSATLLLRRALRRSS